MASKQIDFSNVLLGNETVLLRPFELYDLQDYYNLRCDFLNNQSIGRTSPQNISEIENHINFLLDGAKDRKWINWAIVLRKTNKFIGLICLWNFNENRTTADIGYELHSDYKRMGYMSNAIRLVLELAQNELELSSVYAETRKENIASINLLEKEGFEKIDSRIRSNLSEDYWILEYKRNKVFCKSQI